jgi:two-component system, cell cycle response regulator DivK
MVSGKSQRTVLVVEDKDDARGFLTKYLVLEGYKVLEAQNGLEAVEMVKRKCPDAILMDLNLPQVDGLSAAEQLSHYKGIAGQVPIIAITAHDTDGMEAAALRSGCDAYLKKPLDLTELSRVLNELLSDKQVLEVPA